MGIISSLVMSDGVHCPILDVLGDFQKDFEDGFIPEISGAKYGGYGSFLPTYRRLTQTRSTPKDPDRNIVPSTCGSWYEDTCDVLSNQMKVSCTSSFKNSNLGGSSKVGASTEHHTKDHNVINKSACDGLSNQMKVSKTSSFNNYNLGGSSKVGVFTSATTTENHKKVGTMPVKRKNFHARDVTIEPPKAPEHTVVPSTHGSLYEGTCDGLSNQMKVSSTSFKNSNLGGSSEVGASTSATTTGNHTKHHNVINKVGTMAAKKNFHARDVTIERKSKHLKSQKESSQNYSEEFQREVGRPDLMVSPLIAKKGVKHIKMDMEKSSMKSKSGMLSFEEHVVTFMDGPICDQPSSAVAVSTLDHALVNHWACCDLCEKWRLLPNGMNPGDLPKKWECCMQYWLPASMNSCIITEAKTTNIMNLHYHASHPEANLKLDLTAPSTCSATLRVNQMSHEVVSRCDIDCSQVGRPRIISPERQKQKFKLKGKKLQCCSDEVDINSGVGKDLKFMNNELFHPDIPVKKRKTRERHDTKSKPETALRIFHLGEKKAKIGVEYIESNARKENRDNAPNVKKKNCVLEDLDKTTKESKDKNVAQLGSSGVMELDKLRPMRKCQSSYAVLMATKEARELKHAAERMKNVEQELERATIYFQAALKFLQAASLSEPSRVVNMKYDELKESLKIYNETAAFCEFCALEYDRSNEMAFSALAYKCVEVAYFKVAFLKSQFASKDHQELQETIHAFWPGYSPSSSASHLVNLNQPDALEKITCAKVVSSLKMTDSHATRHSLYRCLYYTQSAVSAFEASMKSQNALAVASARLGKNGIDLIASLKETLNFDFHNVEELLRRIRASMEFFLSLRAL